jgi:hypothetical protein
MLGKTIYKHNWNLTGAVNFSIVLKIAPLPLPLPRDIK